METGHFEVELAQQVSTRHMSQMTRNDEGLVLKNVRVPPSTSGPKDAKLFQKYELEHKRTM